jgi:hypothetical protein
MLTFSVSFFHVSTYLTNHIWPPKSSVQTAKREYIPNHTHSFSWLKPLICIKHFAENDSKLIFEVGRAKGCFIIWAYGNECENNNRSESGARRGRQAATNKFPQSHALRDCNFFQREEKPLALSRWHVAGNCKPLIKRRANHHFASRDWGP